MSWPRDRFVEVTTSLCCGLETLFLGNDIFFSWPRVSCINKSHSNPGLSEMDKTFLLTLNI